MLWKKWILGLGVCMVLISAQAVTIAAGPTFEGFPVVMVLLNGSPVTSDAPAVNLNGRTMLPLRAIAEAAGMDIKWDGASNTATLTSRASIAIADALRAENAQLKADLDGTKAELASTQRALASARAELATADDPVAKPKLTVVAPFTQVVTRDNLVAVLRSDFSTFRSGGHQVRIKWNRNEFSDANSPLFDGVINTADYHDALGSSADLVNWVNSIALMVAKVHPEASVLIVYHDTFDRIPTTPYDSIDLTKDFRWSVTDYLVWSHIKDGEPETAWDRD